jgi:hypothetical protein
VTETRIRWEPNGHSGFLGYAGTLTDSDWLFQVWRLDAVTGTWRLSSSLAGQFAWDLDHDGPDELKATAERWLEEFVSSLGAVFPDRLREAGTSERDAHRMMAGEGHGDCPHSWSSHTSCGSARALDWVLDQMAAVTAPRENG